jgi:MoCo/4Fe-4S cofactor protein with predicted Tat translocation signal
MTDQCPSSIKKGKPGKALLAAEKRELSGDARGQRVWRSLEEAADAPEFRDFLEREFPAGASELSDETTRRSFLKIMGASVALAGAATIPGCRRPDHRIMPYSKVVPEEVIPGKALFYATSMPLPCGGAEGLLVETHEGRPTKVEGNPFHTINRGKSSVWAQASILDMYDPDRLKFPWFRGSGRSLGADAPPAWDDFRAWAREHFARFDQTRGRGLAVLIRKGTGLCRDMARERFQKRFPEAMWVPYSPAEPDGPAAGAAVAFGRPVREQLRLTENGRVLARVILSLDRDFLGQTDPANLVHQREFAVGRGPMTTTSEMTRLYVVESGFSITGSCADHRQRVAPSRVAAVAVRIARAVLAQVGGGPASALARAVAAVDVPGGDDLNEAWVQAVADDLVAEQMGAQKRTRVGETLIVAGASQPAAVHALVHALNSALGNVGKTVAYLPMDAESAASSVQGLSALSRAMGAGQIDTLVCIETNPLYDAPADLDFASLFGRIPHTITLSCSATETAAASLWSLNGTHYLESWGDTVAWDGTVAPVQPMIAPLYAPSLSDVELLALMADPNAGIVAHGGGEAGAPAVARPDDGHLILRAAWRVASGLGEAEFEKAFRRALHDGVAGFLRPPAPAAMPVNMEAVAAEVGKLRIPGPPTGNALDVCFYTGHTADGRFANNGWLQEFPQPGTRVVWDNPALMSPKTAAALGVLPRNMGPDAADASLDTLQSKSAGMYTVKFPSGRRATVTVGGRTLDVAVWILPGMAENTVLLQTGYGRSVAGRVADGVGFNAFKLLSTRSGLIVQGGTLAAQAGYYPISSTQVHWSLAGRDSIVRQVDLAAWAKHGGEPPVSEPDRLYATQKALGFGERVGEGELGHSPPINNIYPHPFYTDVPPPRSATPGPGLAGRSTDPAAGAPFAEGPQWGMTIDLSTCTGCGACTIACQAENNIPIVGKKEVAKNREMHWIRVDRYFTGDDTDNPQAMLHQPVPCMQCENAPCETVCPVNATVHGPEGLNYMTYNRCIGTRYCENNCPYKVRRFNFFDYGVTKFNGDYYFKEGFEAVVPDRGGITGSGTHNKLNPNLIPPRLREKLDQITRLQKNPDVTVRSRGVMEKCTYCIQRINEARIETKLRDLRHVPDGFIKTACQQACPSDAIVFGDILDTASNDGAGSRVRQLRDHPRSYQLLGYLNTRPRTTYLVKVGNPNPRLRAPVEDPFGHGSHEGGHEGGHDGHGEPRGGGRGAGHAAVSRSAFLRDSAKSALDKGYALSLRVLSTVM